MKRLGRAGSRFKLSGSSIVWDDLFSSDQDALAEFERTVAEEGISTFLDGGKVIPFSR